MEKYEEYVDKLGRRFIAVNPSEYGYDQWFNVMVRSTELSDLVMVYPYVNLQADPQGNLVPVDGKSFMGKVTNMFHILHAKWQDKFRAESKPIPDQEYFEWKPSNYVPEEDAPEYRNISYGGERLIMGDDEGYSLKLDKLPEVITVHYPDRNWHPNKDARGFFMSPNQYNNGGYPYGSGYGYGYGYNPYYYGGGGYIGSPSATNPYTYNTYPWNYSNNLPRYKDGYPF